MNTPDQFPDLYSTIVPLTPTNTAAPEAPTQIQGVAPSDLSDYSIRPLQQQSDEAMKAANADPSREELSNMWLSTPKFGVGTQPADLAQLHSIESGAQKLGLSLDDIISDAESKQSFGQRWASKLYRNGGPIYRGVVNSVDSMANFITGSAYHALSFVPGWEDLATKADTNTRESDITRELSDRLNREGSLASIITPAGASLLGSVSQTVADLAQYTVAAGSAVALAPEEGLIATTLAGRKGLAAAAAFFGLKEAEQEITVAKDKGLSPAMVTAHAIGMGGQTAFFTLLFGKWADKLGLATQEQAMLAGKPAVDALIKSTKLGEMLGGIGLSAGEQAAIAVGHMYWGAIDGTDTIDNGMQRVLSAAALGGITRGATEFVSPALQRFQAAFTKTQESMLDVTKGTLEVQRAHEQGRNPVVPDTASEVYKNAVKSETDRIVNNKQIATEALNNIKPDGRDINPTVEDLPTLITRRAALDAKIAQAQQEGLPIANEPFDVTNDIQKQLLKSGLTQQQVDKLKSTIQLQRERIQVEADMKTRAAMPATPMEGSIGEVLKNVSDLRQQQSDLADKIAAAPELAKGLFSKVAPTDTLTSQKAEVDARLKDAEQVYAGISDQNKSAVKAKVIEKLEANRIKDSLNESSDRLDRAQNANTDAFRERMGFKEIPASERITRDQSLQMAIDQGIPQNARTIAVDIRSKVRPATHVEEAGILVAIDNEVDNIQRALVMSKDPNRSPAERIAAELMYRESMKWADVLSETLRISGSEIGRALAMRRYAPVDTLSPGSIRTTAAQIKGSDLTSEEADTFTKAALDAVTTRNLRDSIGRPLNRTEGSEEITDGC